MLKKSRNSAKMTPSSAGNAPAQGRGKGKQPRGRPADEDVTDVGAVTGPIMSLVHDRMQGAWKIYRDSEMWLVFDAVSPVRIFKADMAYNDNADFPAYDSDDAENLTSVDEPPPGLMPYAPDDYA